MLSRRSIAEPGQRKGLDRNADAAIRTILVTFLFHENPPHPLATGLVLYARAPALYELLSALGVCKETYFTSFAWHGQCSVSTANTRALTSADVTALDTVRHTLNATIHHMH